MLELAPAAKPPVSVDTPVTPSVVEMVRAPVMLELAPALKPPIKVVRPVTASVPEKVPVPPEMPPDAVRDATETEPENAAVVGVSGMARVPIKAATVGSVYE